MIPLSAGQLAAVVSGTLAGGAVEDILITGSVEFDSRAVTPGGLFVALVGERVDGHDFASAAADTGAVLTLASRAVATPCVIVDDVLVALGALARHISNQLPKLTTIGITGSAGKTSTKDMVAQLLSGYGPTVAAAGSFNNELGLPITVLRADANTRYLVLELGARGLGHITWLTEVAPPQIGVVLKVGQAHVGEFGTLEVTAQAKGELVAALPSDGVAILNADDDRVAAMRSRTDASVLTFGRNTADVRADNIAMDTYGRARFDLVTDAGSAAVHLQFVGSHQVSNALASAAVGVAVGMDIAAIADGLSTAQALAPGRMQVTNRRDGIAVIDDAYNGNPDSMRAALDAIRDYPTTGARWAVLGFMSELGDTEQVAHEEIGAYAADAVDRLVVVGERASGFAIGFRRAQAASDTDATVHLVTDVRAAAELVSAAWRPGDTVVIKASHAAGLQETARLLIAAPPADGVPPSDIATTT